MECILIGEDLIVYREGGVMLNTTQTEITEQKIYVYPNAVGDKIMVSVNGIYSLENRIELYDVQGRIVQSTTSKESETMLDISQLPTGVYYCVGR
jgi:hypothetical protein